MNINKKSTIKGEISLLLAAVLWGSCFMFQKKGMDYIGPFTLGTFRFILGGLVLLPAIVILSKKRCAAQPTVTHDEIAGLFRGGILCGVFLFVAASLQQVGLVYTTSGKAAFLTSMEIVAVELFGSFVAKKLHLKTLTGVAFAVIGMYLLCINKGFSLQFGDSLELIGAIFWGAQILSIDQYAKSTDVMKLSFLQFIVAGCLSAVCMIVFERPNLADIQESIIPILYTGIIEVALCFTLQIYGQKHVPPVIAAVLLSLESVFAAIFGALFLKEALSSKEIIGMVLILLSVLVIQFPGIRLPKNKPAE
jgi:drug/metabolite transporter (DMT)-like permease